MHVDNLSNTGVVVILTVEWHHFVLVAQLEESFHSAGRVVWSPSVITMRQQHHKTVSDVPLSLSRANELVDDGLSSIGEITKLSLPDNQVIGVGHGVAQLKAQNSELRDIRIRGNESATLRLWNHIGEWHVESFSVLIENMGVSVVVDSSLNVLTRDSDLVSFTEKRSESKRLGCFQGDVLSALNASKPVLKVSSNEVVEVLISWKS